MQAFKLRSILPTLFIAASLSLSVVSAEATGEDSGGSTQQGAPSMQTQTSQGGGSDTALPDLFTGTMSYNIPILVPAGRNGMDPGLSLLYRSGNANGWLGVGWELEVGAIERSTKGGLDYNGDKYLFRMAGATTELVYDGSPEFGFYRAKIEGAFNRFVKQGEYWVVTDRKGTQYFFGQTDATRQYNTDIPDTSKVFKWCLDKVVDTNGNTMTLTYFKDQTNSPGQIYLDQINYPANNYVKFHREIRTDAPEMYTTNFKVKTAYRLKTIEVVANNNKVRAYKLIYDTDPNTAGNQYSTATSRSLLTSVQQFGSNYTIDGNGNVAGETTLPASTFTYNQGTWQNGLQEQSWTTTASNWGAAGYTWVGDFDGDGMTDIATNNYSTITVQRSTGTSFIQEAWTTTASNWGAAGYTWVGDFNGDGRMDIATNNYGTITVQRSTGTSFIQEVWTTTASNWGATSYTWVGDFNGDGKTDIATNNYGTITVQRSTGTSFVQEVWTTTSSNWGSGGYTWVGDFNGDGKMDIATKNYGTITVQRSTGTSFVQEVWTTTSSNWGYIRLGDFNGDGKMDIAAIDHGTITVQLSTGTSFVQKEYTTTASNWGNTDYTWVGDFNSDGKTDIASATGGTIYVKVSTGVLFEDQLWTTTASNWGNSIRVGDFNGDGKTDIATVSGGNIWVKQSNVFNVDLLISIQNGLGATTTITHAPSTDRTVVDYQNTQLPFPVYVVKSLITNDGNNIDSTTVYHYTDGYFHIPEKEFRGFHKVKVTGPAAPNGEQVVTETWFHQGNDTEVDQNTYNASVGYMKGKPYKVKVSDSQEKVYSETTTTYAADNAAPYFNPPSQTNTYIDGDASKVVVSAYTYDQYGNVTEEKRYGDYSNNNADTSDDLTIARTYKYNTTDWILGLPANEIVYQGIGTTGPKVAVTDYYYDGPTDCASPSYNQVPILGKLTSVIRRYAGDASRDAVVRMAYDPYGNLKCSRDPNGNISTIAYDSTNTFPRLATNALNQTAETRYYGVDGEDAGPTATGIYGQVKKVIDPNLVETTNVYDKLGRKLQTITPDGTYTTSYNNFGSGAWSQYIQTTDPANLSSWTYFDGLGRTIYEKGTGPDGKVIAKKTDYDQRGKVTQTSLPYFDTDTPVYTTYTYDPIGRVKEIRSPDGARSLACYSGWTVTTIDANNYAKRETKDAYGRLAFVNEYSGTTTDCANLSGATLYATTTYQYDTLGNLLSVKDAKNNVTSIAYDSLGRKATMHDPDMGDWIYSYDNAGNLISQRDAVGQWIYFRYDKLNRLIQKDYDYFKTIGSGDIVYRYDEETGYGKGRLTSMADQSGAATYWYDSMGRSRRTDKTVNGTTYTTQYGYDSVGRPSAVSYPDSSLIQYSYNGPLLSTVYEGATTYAAYTGYNAMGQPGTVTYGNNVTTSSTYNDRNNPGCLQHNNYRLCSIYTEKSGTPYQSLIYDYDNVGNIKSVNNQIEPTGPKSNYNMGIYTYPQSGANSIRPHAVSTAGGNSYTYDNNGNMKTGAGRSITYDPENRPTTITSNGAATTFWYDGNGTRVKKVNGGNTTIYINSLYECTNGTCEKYIFGGRQRIAKKTVGTGAIVYFHSDHLGSSSVMTDGNGNKIENISYWPYGATKTDDAPGTSHYKYTDQELDDSTGLYNFDARLYDASLGRFVSADTIVPNPRNPQTLNRYAYALNNPLRYTDPSGHAPVCDPDTGGCYDDGTGPSADTSDDDWYPDTTSVDIGIGGGGGTSGGDIGIAGSNPGSGGKSGSAGSNSGSGLLGTIASKIADIFAPGLALLQGDMDSYLSMMQDKLNDPSSYIMGGVGKVGGGQIYERVLSNAELEATRRTGLLRAGREGENFFTDKASIDAKRAQQRLGLDGPFRDQRMQFKIKNDLQVSGPRPAKPGQSGTPGGGREYSTNGPTEIEIIKVEPLKRK